MKILLHICCAPCTIYPLSALRKEGHEVSGLFYNPNIHPYREYEKRAETLLTYARQVDLNIIWSKEYGMENFLRLVIHREQERCRYCYYERLKNAVLIAKEGNFEGFTTTLLYSRFQNHDLIRTIAENLAEEYGVKLMYRDFREGWAEGIKLSRELGMYRQPYCGCIYSEKERFYPGGKERLKLLESYTASTSDSGS